MIDRILRGANRHWGLLTVVAASCVYAVAFSWLSWMKYYTFNATFSDLGLENHVLWLLSHGGVGNYNSSGFGQLYPLQFEQPIIFVFLPLYYVYPSPVLLLVSGSVGLGVGAIPLYLYARMRLSSSSLGVLIAITYFFFFPIASANLFDFHYEDFFPFLFLTTVYFEACHRKLPFVVFACLTAAINPLTLVTVVFFVVYSVFPKGGTALGLGFFKKSLSTLARDIPKVALIVGLLVILVVYRETGYLFNAGLGSTLGSYSPTEIVLFAINDKIQLFLLLFGALAFLPFYAGRPLFVLVPYAAYAIYSTDSANYATFGLMYTALAAGPLYLALVEALTRFPTEERTTPRAESEQTVRSSLSENERWRLEGLPPRHRLVGALFVITIVFGTVYFPFSPVNESVTGGYFNGNHDYQTITTVTPQIGFLWRVLPLIPESAGVLTQNNIPQLSSREYVQTETLHSATIPYEYVLLDTQLAYFSSPNDLVNVVNPLLQNGSVGVVAEGEGALLVEKGYTGLPELFEPFEATYNSNNLTPYGNSMIVGDKIVSNQSSYSMWYGPYVTLFPGQYDVTFSLQSSESLPANSTAISLDCSTNGGSTLLAQRTLDLGNFTAPNVTTSFTLVFNITSITANVEFRGMFPTGASRLTLEGISVAQVD